MTDRLPIEYGAMWGGPQSGRPCRASRPTAAITLASLPRSPSLPLPRFRPPCPDAMSLLRPGFVYYVCSPGLAGVAQNACGTGAPLSPRSAELVRTAASPGRHRLPLPGWATPARRCATSFSGDGQAPKTPRTNRVWLRSMPVLASPPFIRRMSSREGLGGAVSHGQPPWLDRRGTTVPQRVARSFTLLSTFERLAQSDPVVSLTPERSSRRAGFQAAFPPRYRACCVCRLHRRRPGSLSRKEPGAGGALPERGHNCAGSARAGW
jgi:hypothetical protein